jgi:hypothetical protein
MLGAGAVLRSRWRAPAVLLLGSLTLTAAITWYQPLVSAQQLAFTPAAGGGADATYVGTGLLPIRLTAHDGARADGPSVELRAGEVGTVHVARADEHGKLRVSLVPVVTWWWWLVLVAACFVPALYSATVGLRTRRPAPVRA